MAKRRKAANASKKRKLWTVICIVVIVAVALFVRMSVVYKVYPLEYEEEISRWSETYIIDEYLVCAVISTESGFDAQAESPKGAAGLMQIMPSTGEWVAGKIGMDDYSRDMLLEPDTNIQLGCWYLNYLGGKFDGDARKVLAAYNAGPARVQEWAETDSELEEIPYEETKNYLERVQRNYEIYKGLYNVF